MLKAVDFDSCFACIQVFLPPNFVAMVTKDAYEEDSSPGITFVDLVEKREGLFKR